MMAASRRPYRVLHLIDHLGSGGAQEAVCQLVAYRTPRLLSPEVLCLHGFGPYFERLRSWGIPVYTLAPHRSACRALPLIIARLGLHLTRRPYDIIHTHLIGANVLGGLVGAFFKVPVRLTHDQTHDDLRHRKVLVRFLDRLANQRNHHIIAVSASIRDFLCRWEGIPADKISVIYNAVDLQRFSPAPEPDAKERARRRLGFPTRAWIIGGVGRLHYQKNFALFLRVAAQVSRRHPETFFVIAGEGPERDRLVELSRRLGLEGRVRFLGFVGDMPAFYQALDLLLLTSDFEGTPLTVLEALAMGVPVVASAVDGVAETLVDGQEALLATPGQLAEFVHKVELLLREPPLRHHLSQQGREKVLRQFSAAAMVRQVENLYCRCLGI